MLELLEVPPLAADLVAERLQEAVRVLMAFRGHNRGDSPASAAFQFHGIAQGRNGPSIRDAQREAALRVSIRSAALLAKAGDADRAEREGGEKRSVRVEVMGTVHSEDP